VGFLIMATTTAPLSISAAAVSYARKPYHSSDIHGDYRLYCDHLYNRTPGVSGSVQLNDFAFKERRLKVSTSQFTASLDVGYDKRNVEGLLSLRKAITLDPYGLLSTWAAENSDNLCLWYGIMCISNRSTGSMPQAICKLSQLTHVYLGGNMLTGKLPKGFANLRMLKELAIAGAYRKPFPT